MYARPIQVQTKGHLNLQFLVVTYAMGFLRSAQYRRCLNGSGLCYMFNRFLETEVHHSLLENAFLRIKNLCFASR